MKEIRDKVLPVFPKTFMQRQVKFAILLHKFDPKRDGADGNWMSGYEES